RQTHPPIVARRSYHLGSDASGYSTVRRQTVERPELFERVVHILLASRPARTALSASAKRCIPVRIWLGSKPPKLKSRPARGRYLMAKREIGVTSTSCSAAARATAFSSSPAASHPTHCNPAPLGTTSSNPARCRWASVRN